MRAFGLTDIGLKRASNQDAFYLDPDRQIYIVADGMGGHKAGDLASRTAVVRVCEYLFKRNPLINSISDTKDLIRAAAERCRESIEYANHVIYQQANDDLEFTGMGTTLVMLLILSGHAIVAHVGDSRVYRIQDDSIEQLTKDHSRVQELIDQERISPEEAMRYPLKNVITRALGGAYHVEVDVQILPLGRNDVFVLCTDGLTGVLTDNEIWELISANPGDPEESCRRLIQSTLNRGAPDNVTVVVSDTRAYSGGEPSDPPQGSPPNYDAGHGAFRRFIDRWFKGNQNPNH